ncbi:phosphoglycerate dehydrogenase [Noviherbaspirillum autotrophicum]|uniref:D-3-phosphoglycerate dehydrogenase n=1 Tax=Noviherbaspirillum autotrophicum TaxID=709839 RepID=A0A0C1XYS0_9BURK|nr:phosphoglycerate dehydrogenase [Noviherbaspirillum autotrophicum]KIF79893.1 D-3-phosphoglycerate dehydrogenase [Noviherbaspirillum autotrophicum]
MAKIVLLEKIHASAAQLLNNEGIAEIVQLPTALQANELKKALEGADAVGIRSATHITAEVLQALPQLRAIGCFCIGTNQVDLTAAAAHGVPVFNAPFSNTRSVAELVIAESILLLRRIPEKNVRTHRGQWDKTAQGAYEVRNKLLGIIGYGNIGAQVGILAESVGMRVCYYDVESKLPLGNAKPMATMEALLAEADIVTLHVPGGSATERLITGERLALMKPSAVLLNASRGGVVDIDALNAALREGRLAGAALDVFPKEPRNDKEEFISPLRGLDNVILTPHIGGSTEEAQENIGREVADKLARFLKAGTTRWAVNFPEIPHLEKQTKSRVLNVHRNEPGVIARMNADFAQAGLNIVAQHLQTRGPIGYVITDVDDGISTALLQKLRSEPATIRCELI